MLAAVHHNADEAIDLLLVLVALLCLLGAGWRAWLRDFPAAAGLIVVAIVLLVLRAYL